MSYNISTWKTKRLENFVIPLHALYDISEDLKQRGWMPRPPQITFKKDDAPLVEIHGLGEGLIIGEPSLLDNNMLMVSKIVCYGEGSGTFMSEILKPVLAKSMGILEAILIWESGDTISRLVVENGKITESDVEF